jgi:hypothetical protein
MLHVSLVRAEADAGTALHLEEYLGLNCYVDIQHLSTGDDLLEAIGRGLSADVMILLLSPHSVPGPLKRSEWEPLLGNPLEDHSTDVAFVSLAPCPFPKVLMRSNVFDYRTDPLACARALKRWIFSLRPPACPASLPRTTDGVAPEILWTQLADRPATVRLASVAAARAFAEQSADDFESIFWIDARAVTLTEVTGDLSVQMGLQPSGPTPQNLETIRDLCRRYRCLLVLEGANNDVADAFDPLERSSVVVVEPGDPLPPVTPAMVADQAAALSHWISNPAAAVPNSAAIRRTLDWLMAHDWNRALQFAGPAISYHKQHRRLAEAFALLELIIDDAVRHGNPEALHFARERQWILEEWGLAPEWPAHFVPPRLPEQMSFFT